MKKILLIILSSFFLFSWASANDDDITKAMSDELSRSMKELKMDKLGSPYFIQYELTISKPFVISTSLGGTYSKNSGKSAVLDVTCKVGDYKFDNTNFISGGFIFFGGGGRDDEERYQDRSISYEIDYPQLRRELWLATDAAYKKAAEEFSQKEAVAKSRLRKDTTWDYIKIEPKQSRDVVPFEQIDEKKIEAILDKISAIFKEYKDVFTSKVSFEYLPETKYFVNSEKMEYIKSSAKFGFEITGTSQSTDGMSVYDFYTCYGNSLSQLPSEDSLIKAAYQIAKNITALKNAPVLDEDYSGPVIFEGQAAGELFAQIFAPNLVTRREKISSAGFPFNDNFKAFQTKIGGRVLPEFLSLSDAPKQKEYNGIPLFGVYNLDDEGVDAQDVLLVDKGYLKTLLSSRVPTKRVKVTNGHFRNGSTIVANMFVTANPKFVMTNDKLVAKMMKLCKDRDLEYGIVVKKVTDNNIFTTSLFEQLFSGDYSFLPGGNAITLCEAYKVYRDGHQELIRGSVASGITTQSFKDIINVGKTQNVLNLWLSGSGSGNWTNASIIAPDLLFEDAEIKTIDKDFKKPPILDNPLSSK
ncbi:MAG: metallopeptidase TldD-related protein [bacterium]